MNEKVVRYLPFRQQDLGQYRIRESLLHPEQDFQNEMRRYRGASDRARRGLHRFFTTRSYGRAEHEKLDVYRSGRPGSAIFLFIHGGAWRYLGREDSAMMAPALHANGVTTVTIDYGLSPAFTLPAILDQCDRALDWVVCNATEIDGDPQRIHISGSSAGAHLAAMLLGRDAGRPVHERRIQSASLLSGVMDLHPVRHSYMNEWLGLDDEMVVSLSPVLHLPAPETRLLVAWGELEPPVMQEQSRHYALQCVNADVPMRTVISPQKNHYNVLMDLGDQESEIFCRTLGLVLT